MHNGIIEYHIKGAFFNFKREFLNLRFGLLLTNNNDFKIFRGISLLVKIYFKCLVSWYMESYLPKLNFKIGQT